MSLTAGIVGLPNVGKSTLFNAITNQKILAENYPFATIEPNVGVVTVPDERMDKLKSMYEPNKFIPTAYEFTDIAGLVKGASKGEGLGNKFLSHIREVDAIVEVVRCFDNGKIIHVDGNVDPIRDIETINLELIISDLDIINNRLEKVSKKARTTKDKDSLIEVEALEKAKESLEKNIPLRSIEFSEEEEKVLKSYSFLTIKPIIYLANIDEDELGKEDNDYVKTVKEYAKAENSKVVSLCAKVEEELSELSLDDLFKIADQFSENERLFLSFDGQKSSSFMVGKNYKVAVDMGWIFSYAFREDVFNYMDINDKMLDYLYAKLSKRKRYRDIKPFKLVEQNYSNSQNFTLLKKAK